MRIFLIDHRDSFTFNLAHLLSGFGEVSVIEYPASLSFLSELHFPQESAVVLSPGPGCPMDYPETIELYRRVVSRKIPLIGVCLGFQILLFAEGCSLKKMNKPAHGVQETIDVDLNSRTYSDFPPQISIGRYHSLQVVPEKIPSTFKVTALGATGTVPLSVEHLQFSIFGFQFHPESFLCNCGEKIFKNVFSSSRFR